MSSVPDRVDVTQEIVLRAILDQTALTTYAALRRTPGFALVLRELVDELKAGGIFPDAFIQAVEAIGGEPRLLELARLYAAYQRRLEQEGWADGAGLGWLAAEALRRRAALCADWQHLFVDGFDDLTPVQLDVIALLAERVPCVTITLTGVCQHPPRPFVHKRFNRTRHRLEERLRVDASPLPRAAGAASCLQPALAHLERSLFSDDSQPEPAGDAVALVAAPDREAEVRAGLRWLKQRVVHDGMKASEVALLCRSIEPYRAFIDQTAREFGLPLHVVGGLPLRSNPAVTAVLDLLRLIVPGDGHLAWRPTVASWRSPYLDWNTCLGIRPEDAEALDWVARWGSVIAGLDHWEEAFGLLLAAYASERIDDQVEPGASEILPAGVEIGTLWRKFQGFLSCVTPPQGNQRCRDFVSWVEDLIGEAPRPTGSATGPIGLGVARRAQLGHTALVERDLAALNALKDVLRGLVWAEEAVGCEPVIFQTFIDDLLGAVAAARYRIPLPSTEEAILVADVTQARGLPFRAVAVLGLAEGEFPRTLDEDPFLRDVDRLRLRDEVGLALDPSTEGAESEYLYEAVTRPAQALLLTRPRIADNGAPWPPSPYWEEVHRLLDVTPLLLSSRSRPALDEAASWPELLETLATEGPNAPCWSWAFNHQPVLCSRIEGAQQILTPRFRGGGREGSAFEGDLTRWRPAFESAYGPRYVWSASRLEAYRTCPFFFFVAHVLRLEPREPPSEGPDARQLGNIYHRILERLYNEAGLSTDDGREPETEVLVEAPITLLERLRRALPWVAREVLDAAPRQEQFRATAWWDQTCAEIEQHVAQSLETLETLEPRFRFHTAEQSFGIPGKPGPPLELRDDGGDILRLRGFIDRADCTPGNQVRVIDYKTAGPGARYAPKAVREGKNLQLPLYALAAEQALGLGPVTDGFYWHVRHAAPSSFTLAKYGPQAAIEVAVRYAWQAVHGVRQGTFVPEPPDGGCPGYCPAAAFCWRYQPARWG